MQNTTFESVLCELQDKITLDYDLFQALIIANQKSREVLPAIQDFLAGRLDYVRFVTFITRALER